MKLGGHGEHEKMENNHKPDDTLFYGIYWQRPRKSLQTRLENMILGHFIMGKHQAKCRALKLYCTVGHFVLGGFSIK